MVSKALATVAGCIWFVGLAIAGAQDLPLRILSGDWRQAGGIVQQTSPDVERAVALVEGGNWSTYRASVMARAIRPMQEGESFGLIAHGIDENNYYVFRIIQKKGGVFGELARHGIALARHREEPLEGTADFVGDLAPLEIDPTDWHELRIDTDGIHICAFLDDQKVLAESFSGRPSPTAAYPAVWPMDLVAGVPGYETRGASAEFKSYTFERLSTADEVVAPLKPTIDSRGMLLPRRPYDQIVRDQINWFLGAGQVTEEPADLPEVASGWHPLFLISHTTVDDGPGYSDIQYPGHNHPPCLMGLVDYYLYSGDRRALDMAREIGDWNLKYCLPEGWAGAGLPLSHFDYVALGEDGSYDPLKVKSPHAIRRFEPDKAAYSGEALVRLYAVTADKRYLDAARRIGKTLIGLQLPAGNFPFRIDPQSGEVLAEYTCSVVWYLRFLDGLYSFTSDDEVKAARDRALKWLLDNPVQTNDWQGFYGDIKSGTKSYDQWTALETAMYLIDHRTDDPTFVDKAKRIVDWCMGELVTYDGYHPGVPVVIEQTVFSVVLPHHVIRLADAYAHLYGATRDPEHKRLAELIGNSASWMQKSDGKFMWGVSGFSRYSSLILSYASHYIRMMAEMPETAPNGENHLLQQDGSVKNIDYKERKVSYETWRGGRERLKLASKPREIKGAGASVNSATELDSASAGWYWNEEAKTLDVRHQGTEVVIDLAR